MNLDHLVGGAVYGATFAFIAIAAPRYTRQLLAAVLVVAALCYVAFAIAAPAGAPWILAELAGVGIYGYVAMRGLRGSAWWLVAGYALHPIWDVALHLAGPGGSFSPEWYAASCLTYDLFVAGIAAIAVLIGTHLSDMRARTPAVVSSLRASTCTCTACGTMGACAA